PPCCPGHVPFSEPATGYGMPEVPLTTRSETADPRDTLPEVRLELRSGTQSTTYPLGDVSFLIGTVPGCDLRIPGTELPPVLCLIARRPGAVTVRKLTATQPILVNGRPVSSATLTHGDKVSAGGVELSVTIEMAAAAPG